MKQLLPMLLLVVVGCTTAAIFKDPKTGQVAQCTNSTPGIFPIIAQHEIDECSAHFTAMGWQKQ